MSWVTEFIDNCRSIAQNPEKHHLSVHAFAGEKESSENNCYWSIFKMEEKMVKLSKQLLRWQNSRYFLHIWEQAKSEDRLQTHTQSDFAKHYWTPVEDKFTTYMTQLCNGSILIEEFRKIDKTLDKDDAALRSDMLLNEASEDIISARIKQIQIVRQSRQQENIINAINQLRKVCRLDGDFSAISPFIDQVQNNCILFFHLNSIVLLHLFIIFGVLTKTNNVYSIYTCPQHSLFESHIQ